MNEKRPFGDLIASLKERAKELNCLYGIEEVLSQPDLKPEDFCRGVIKVIPPGWQYPGICQARITLGDATVASAGYRETPWTQTAEIRAGERLVGSISVSYTKEMPEEDNGPFLAEEARLIQTIAERIGYNFHYQEMKAHFQELESARTKLARHSDGNWQTILDILCHTDRTLFQKIGHKMLYHLCWSGIEEAEQLLQDADLYRKGDDEELHLDSNRPYQKRSSAFPDSVGREVFRIASQHLSDESILFRIQKWLQEDKMGFLVRAVERNLPLPDVADAIRRYHHISSEESGLSEPLRAGVRVSLIRRFLSDQLPYIHVAKQHMGINDFHELLEHMIYAGDSHGRLGGKSAGLYLAAQILKNRSRLYSELESVKIPRSWHITSDMHLDFMHYNNLDEIVEQKYKEMSQIRFEYPHLVLTCKNARFPLELIKGLSVALDDLGDKPLIVRSSSVLEDRAGAAFSGKYKSLFLANLGTKKERLEALMDAVAEVYASMFGPDPIEYRRARGLLDFAEEMGILIQEVVGRRVGRYYFPLFAGVAFSRNEFRWSPRIKREDGLVRLVPGLGTRAVDRLGDDYPVMFAPGQPGLRVNVSVDERLRYSPRYMDVIDLEARQFVTLDAAKLVAEYREEIPGIEKLVSLHQGGEIRPLAVTEMRVAAKDVVLGFEGLMADRLFVKRAQTMLRVLEEEMGMPVDLEFAHDGQSLYLLQCRSQSSLDEVLPSPIPKDVPERDVIFTARKFVSNGVIPDITHIVYVDPEKYANLPDRSSLIEVGRAVGQINKNLPKGRFILMGPGRWGSRGDVKLGVPVTYSEINNCAMLIEIARQKGNYTPEVSFGTHFFQDLVESRIAYLPLYPDEPGNAFNERFLRGAANRLADLAPEYAHLSETLRVIDVPAAAGGRLLRIFMNADLDEALAMLDDPGNELRPATSASRPAVKLTEDDHWRWRLRMAERIARLTDADRFGVNAMYVIGSAKNCNAGAASDLDLLIHVSHDVEKRRALETWLDGWSLALAEVNYLRTGYKSDGLLDVHIVTDADIAAETSFAVKIGAVTDAARPLPLGEKKA